MRLKLNSNRLCLKISTRLLLRVLFEIERVLFKLSNDLFLIYSINRFKSLNKSKKSVDFPYSIAFAWIPIAF